MDARFTEALKELVGDRYDDFPTATLTMLGQLWDKALGEGEDAVNSDIPIYRNLTVNEFREIRDCLLKCINYVDWPTYPENPDGSPLENDDPRHMAWSDLQNQATVKHDEMSHFRTDSIPAVAPLHESIFADAAGMMENQGHEVLLWVMNPREFADVQKLHLLHHASGDIKLFDRPDSPIMATFWGVPVVKTNKIYGAFLVCSNADPIDPGKPTFTMLNGRHLRFVELMVTR